MFVPEPEEAVTGVVAGEPVASPRVATAPDTITGSVNVTVTGTTWPAR